MYMLEYNKEVFILNSANKKEKRTMHLGNGFVGMKKVKKSILYKNLFKKQLGE